MKQLAQRTLLLALLGGFAVIWTFLMGLGVGSTNTGMQTAPGFSSTDGIVSGTGAQITYVDESRFPAVTAYLVANDQVGQPVLNLQKENFVLTEDGSSVPITQFTTAGNQATTIVLVIDQSGSMNDERKFTSAQQAAISFVGKLKPGQDQVGLIVFNNGVDLIEPLATVTAASKGALLNKIRTLSAYGGTEFYSAVQIAIEQLRAVSGRKIVLALTDGLDNNGAYYLASTIDAARDANVAVYPIGLGSDVDGAGLKQLADASNGEYYFSPSADELEKLYLEIGSNLRNEYALTYQSVTPNLDGTQRNLQVTLTTASGEKIQAGGAYGVAGVLATSLNPVLFFPLLTSLLVALAALYQLPQWQRRPSPPLEESFTPRAGTPPASPNTQPKTLSPSPAGIAPMPTPLAKVTPTAVSPIAVPAGAIAMATGAGSISDGAMVTPSGPALVQQLPLVTPETVIGSAPGSHIVLAHASVKPQHARITASDHRYVIDDLSAGHTQVSFSGNPGQLRSVERNALRNGSLLRLGEVQLTLRQSESQPTFLERRIPLSGASLIIGSDPACDLIIPGAALRQVRLLQDGQRWVVEDLAGGGSFISYSGNPTEERPINGRNAVKSGSRLRMGAIALCLEV
ncbi:MAG: VWA domain-containing protein [Caldilineaceae bacterium]|nr:VWA domain-containing protein [Caldilineaceae bacterium]